MDWWWAGVIGLPLLGAALHPLLGWCVQGGTKAGVRLTVIVGVSNLLTTSVFFDLSEADGRVGNFGFGLVGDC